MESITYPPGSVASTRKPTGTSRSSGTHIPASMQRFQCDPRRTLPSSRAALEEPEPDTLLCEGRTRSHGYVQLPKLVLYARNLSRDAKLLYIVLLGYAWQEQRCWPGYTRLCADLAASENMVRKYMRELEAVQLLSQRRRGQGRSNVYLLHDLRTAKIEVQDHHKSAVLEPQESEDYEEAGEIQTDEQEDRTIGERPGRKSRGTAEKDEKALVGGEPAWSAAITPISSRCSTTRPRCIPARETPAKAQEVSPRDQVLAQARAVVGAALEERLRALGGSNPAGGAETILAALVEVQTPCEVMSALVEVGAQRLSQRQEREHIPNPTGYLIGIMRNLAVEAWLKGWNLAHIQVEDEEKHTQAVRSAARTGNSVLTYDGSAAPPEEAPPSEVLEVPDIAPAAASVSNVPEGVEVADAATVVTWYDYVPDLEGGKPRSVSLLWGFVREEIKDRLNIARRQHLEALVPKWDAARPRTLLLLCDLTYTARAVELSLRRELAPPFDKLLSQFFDEFQVVYAPGLEESA